MGATQGSPALLLLLLAVGTQTTLCSSKKIACHTRTPDWGGEAAKIPLQCEDTEWIHVIAETVALRGSETPCNHSNCSAVRKDDQSGLSPQCSRQSNCSEAVDLGGLAACDGGQQADYVAVLYECIPGSAVYDLRSETVPEVSSTAVYLSTIGDGQNPFVSVSNRLRRCRLTASGPGHVSVEALQLYFQDGVELNITDNCREGGGWMHGRNGNLLVNKHVHSIECSSADITFHDHGKTPHLAWLRFTATSPLTLTCGDHDPVSASLPTTAAATPTSDVTSDNPYVYSTAVLACVCGALAAALLVCVLLRLRKPASTERDPTYQAVLAPEARENHAYEEMRVYDDAVPA